jgi:hypothetical protein
MPLNADPYSDPTYDYYQLYKTGWTPPPDWGQLPGGQAGHFPSPYKSDDNARVILNGVDTRTGQTVAASSYTGPKTADMPPPESGRPAYHQKYAWPEASWADQTVQEAFEKTDPKFLADVVRTLGPRALHTRLADLDASKDPRWLVLRQRQARDQMQKTTGINTIGDWAKAHNEPLVPGVKYDDPRLSLEVPLLEGTYEIDNNAALAMLRNSQLIETPKNASDYAVSFDRTMNNYVTQLRDLRTRIDRLGASRSWRAAADLIGQYNILRDKAVAVLGANAATLHGFGVDVDVSAMDAYGPISKDEGINLVGGGVAQEQEALTRARIAQIRLGLAEETAGRAAQSARISLARYQLALQEHLDKIPPKVDAAFKQDIANFNAATAGSPEEAAAGQNLYRIIRSEGIGIPGPSGQDISFDPKTGQRVIPKDFQFMPIVKSPKVNRGGELARLNEVTIPTFERRKGQLQSEYDALVTQYRDMAKRAGYEQRGGADPDVGDYVKPKSLLDLKDPSLVPQLEGIRAQIAGKKAQYQGVLGQLGVAQAQREVLMQPAALPSGIPQGSRPAPWGRVPLDPAKFQGQIKQDPAHPTDYYKSDGSQWWILPPGYIPTPKK